MWRHTRHGVPLRRRRNAHAAKTLGSRRCWLAGKALPSLVRPGDSHFLCLRHFVKEPPVPQAANAGTRKPRRCVEMGALVFEMEEGGVAGCVGLLGVHRCAEVARHERRKPR